MSTTKRNIASDDKVAAEKPDDRTVEAAKVVGILSGISYVSGIDYYKGINTQYQALVKPGYIMPPNPLMMMLSIDCDHYAHMLTQKNWEGVSKHLTENVGRLVKGGCDFLTIASNTGHICVPSVQALYPELKVLHIADCTALEIKKMGLSHVGLLGTEPTMRENYLKDQLARHGISTVVPDKEQDLHQIFQYIMHELGQGVFKPATRKYFQAQIKALVARGAEGIILGCTEIELLIRPQDMPKGVPRFASAALHISATAKVCAGLAVLSDFDPFLHSGNLKKRKREVKKATVKRETTVTTKKKLPRAS